MLKTTGSDKGKLIIVFQNESTIWAHFCINSS